MNPPSIDEKKNSPQKTINLLSIIQSVVKSPEDQCYIIPSTESKPDTTIPQIACHDKKTIITRLKAKYPTIIETAPTPMRSEMKIDDLHFSITDTDTLDIETQHSHISYPIPIYPFSAMNPDPQHQSFRTFITLSLLTLIPIVLIYLFIYRIGWDLGEILFPKDEYPYWIQTVFSLLAIMLTFFIFAWLLYRYYQKTDRPIKHLGE